MGKERRKKGWPRWPWILSLLLLAAIILALHFNYSFHSGGDNCRYLNVARSLRSGEGFIASWLPGNPPTRLLSPGYVVLIAGAMELFGNNRPIMPLKLLSAISFLVFILILFSIYVRYLRIPKIAALLISLFLCLNVTLNSYGSYILTEAPFLMLMSLALLFLFEWDDSGDAPPLLLG